MSYFPQPSIQLRVVSLASVLGEVGNPFEEGKNPQSSQYVLTTIFERNKRYDILFSSIEPAKIVSFSLEHSMLLQIGTSVACIRLGVLSELLPVQLNLFNRFLVSQPPIAMMKNL